MNDNFGGIPIKDEYKAKLRNNNNINNIKTNKNKKNGKIKKWILNFLLVFFVGVAGYGIYELVKWNIDNIDTAKVLAEIEDNVIVKEEKDDENTEIIGQPEEDEKEPEILSDYWYYVKFPLIDVDINSLKKKNSDTVGWINVNNTNINYPYVQSKDNKYYLNRSYDRSYNDAGWVFMDYRNNSNLDNKNTILYAHSRLDKTMFGSLSKVLKSEWHANKDNHIIRISTSDENTLWQIFSVYKIEAESYYITTDFNNDSEYNKFLKTIKKRSIYNFNTSLDTNDKILTLSTCYDDGVRTVVHAKLIKRSKKD